MRWSLRHRFLASLGIVAFVASLVFVIRGGAAMDASSAGAGEVYIGFDFPKGTTLAEANVESTKIEKWAMAHKKEWKLRSVRARFNRRDGHVTLNLEQGLTPAFIRKIAKTVREGMPELPGIEPEVRSGAGDDDEAQEGNRGFFIHLRGRDSDYLRTWAQTTKEALLAEGLAEDVDLGNTEGQDEIRLDVDRQRMHELGVEPEILFGIVSAGLRGRQISRMRQPDGRDLRLIAEYDDSERMELTDLKELQIWSRDTGFRRLADMAGFRFAQGYRSISRHNGVLTTAVAGSRPDDVSLTDFEAGLARVMSSMPIPRGYKWEIGGVARRQGEQMDELLYTGLISLTLIFLVMGLLFESVVLPLAVFVTIPLAGVGGFAGLILLGKLIDVSVIFGAIILAGVVVNNGIVLLDHIVRLRKEGLDRTAAILQGVRDRMRAILMTATTTIVGLLPMALAVDNAREGFSYVGMATLVACGLAFATFLTPLAVSLTYTVLDDLVLWWRGVLAHARVHRSAARGGAHVPQPLAKR